MRLFYVRIIACILVSAHLCAVNAIKLSLKSMGCKDIIACIAVSAHTRVCAHLLVQRVKRNLKLTTGFRITSNARAKWDISVGEQKKP
jgi:hypothetical protein